MIFIIVLMITVKTVLDRQNIAQRAHHYKFESHYVDQLR